MQAENISEKLRQAFSLKQNDDWRGALELYEQVYALEGYEKDQNLTLSLLSCLKKVENYDRAIEIGLPACAHDDHWDAVANITAWCIYYRYFKKDDPLPAEQAVEWLETLKRISPLKQGLHPLPMAIFSWLAKSEKLLPNLVIQVCGMLDPNLLDSTPQPGPKPGVSYPSPREKYATHMSKALFNAGDYTACLALCRDTLSPTLKLASQADVWFKRRAALCLGKLGDFRSALIEYEDILKRKRDWFILYEAALAAYRLEQLDLSLELALQAANAYGETDTKIHLWELLQNLMARKKEFDRAVAMLKLCAAIRKQRNWKMDRDLLLDLQAHNLDPAALPPYKSLLAECKTWLDPTPAGAGEELRGVISNLLPHGKAGFIRAGSLSCYFQIAQCQFPPDEARVGMKVSFHTQKSFDRKKQQESLIAIRIKRAG